MADGSVTYEIKIDDKGASNAIEKFKGSAEKTGEEGTKSFLNMDAAALKLKATIARAAKALADFVAKSLETGMQFDKSMSQVAATMGVTVDDIQELREFALQMGSTTAFSAQQAADGLNILAQSGLLANEQMEVLPEVLNLAAAGNLDLATSASYVTGSLKGFGDDVSNASHYTDMLAVGASKCNTNVNQLGMALSTAASTSSAYGQTSEGTTLALMRLAEQNVTGAEAATALNRAMMDLYTPTSSAKKQLEALGVAVYDESGNARDFNTVVDELNAALSGMSDEEKLAAENAIFSTYGLQAFNKMTTTSTDKVDGFRDALANANGAAEEMANTQLNNLAGDMTLFQSAVEGLQIKISDVLVPALRELMSFAMSAVDGISSFIEAHSETFSQLAHILGTVLGTALKFVAAGFEVIAGVIGVVLNLVSPLIDVIAGFVDTVTNLFNKDLSETMEQIRAILDAMPDWLSGLAEQALQIISQWAAQFISWAQKAGADFVANMQSYLAKLPGEAKQFLDNVISAVISFAADLGSKALQAGADFINMLKSGIEGGFGAVIAFIQSIPQSILNGLGDMGSLLWNAGSQIIAGFLNGIRAKFEEVKSFVSGIGDWIASHKGPEQYDKTLLIKQGGWIMESLATGLNEGKSDVLDALNGITADISGYTVDANLQPSATSGVFNNTTIVNINGITSSSPSVLEAAGNLVSAVQLDLRMGVA